jgi:hypothetical protein
MKRPCIGLILTMLLAGCSSTGGLGAAADRLDNTAHNFYERLHTPPTTGHAASDAALLAEAAREFNRAVDRDASPSTCGRHSIVSPSVTTTCAGNWMTGLTTISTNVRASPP